MTADLKHCCKMVSDGTGYYFHPCGNPTKVIRSGKPYCGIHDPQRAPSKAQVEAAQRRAERVASRDANALAHEIAKMLVHRGDPSGLVERYVAAMAAAGREI